MFEGVNSSKNPEAALYITAQRGLMRLWETKLSTLGISAKEADRLWADPENPHSPSASFADFTKAHVDQIKDAAQGHLEQDEITALFESFLREWQEGGGTMPTKRTIN